MVAKKGIFAVVGLCALLALVAVIWSSHRQSPESDRRKPKIAILSSIPLQWGEADLSQIAAGEARPDPLVGRLSEHGNVIFVDSVEAVQAARPHVAILIQPRPISPDDLVRLDNWVRAGGRLLLFADPALQWPSELPFGDPQRPLFTSMLSPILAHWGLELALPMDSDHELVETRHSGETLQWVSPGIWSATGSKEATGNCRIDLMVQLAECRPGKGQVLLVADADLLQSEMWQSGVPNIDRNGNMNWTKRLIRALEAGTRVVR